MFFVGGGCNGDLAEIVAEFFCEVVGFCRLLVGWSFVCVGCTFVAVLVPCGVAESLVVVE